MKNKNYRLPISLDKVTKEKLQEISSHWGASMSGSIARLIREFEIPERKFNLTIAVSSTSSKEEIEAEVKKAIAAVKERTPVETKNQP